MTRQLIVCCDGTNNNLTGRRNDSNVTQLCELLKPQAQNQLLYYDPGVGNPAELPGTGLFGTLRRHYERLRGLVFGKGIYENIQEAYLFLMNNWRPGDQIFFFGFSRGAFTARSVSGLVAKFGILRPDMQILVPTLLHIYFSDRKEEPKNPKEKEVKAEFDRMCQQLRELYSRDEAKEAAVWFVGAWDTVESVGAPLVSRKMTATPTIAHKRFRHVRHAMSLDEYRRTFLPRPYLIEQGYDYALHGQSIRQEWFSGAHCDVGGGYGNSQAGLSRQTLLWMIREAAGCQLRLRPGLLDAAGQPSPALIADHLDRVSTYSGKRQKIVHSQLYESPWWALGGQVVRNPHELHGQQKFNKPLAPPFESPTVRANSLAFAGDTDWRQPLLLKPVDDPARPCVKSWWHYLAQPWLGMAAALVLALVFWTAAGALLLGPQVILGQSLGEHFWAMFGSLRQAWDANFDFARWQVLWFSSGQAPLQSLATAGAAVHPARALAADFAFIAAYSYPLACAVSWAFARVAGLRRVGMGRARGLNVLGWAACVMVLGDVAENVFTAVVLFSSTQPYILWLEWLLGGLMTLAAFAKWTGCVGSVLLVAWACLPQRAGSKSTAATPAAAA
ncbi:MAG: hypothetical protein JWR60_2840 [Polaromonas sp.]|nr:hypothetical protein [Polaromonas sp.]